MEGVLRKPRRQATVEQAIRTSLVRQTDNEQYKRCLVHDRCTTREPVIKGHQIPQSYMRRLPGGNNMAIFGKRRFGWPESKLPLSEGIGFATAGYFTCKSHDDWFQDVDRLSDIPALPDKRTLHLMCYRSILYNRWWMHLWAQASARIRDWYGAISQYQINERLLIDDRKMLRSQKAIEQCLESDDSDPQTYSHMMLTAEGPPVLAASVFGVLHSLTDNSGNERIVELGQWGLTLVPGNTSNTLFLHFPTALGKRVIDMALPTIGKGKSRVSGQEITRAIFASCYDIVFSQTSWKSLDETEKNQIRRAAFGRTADAELDLDAFKGGEWVVI